MASSAGGMTKLLLSGSHIPSPKVYVNLQRTKKKRVRGTRKVIGLDFSKHILKQGKVTEVQGGAGLKPVNQLELASSPCSCILPQSKDMQVRLTQSECEWLFLSVYDPVYTWF